jgi:hypothetical protein
LGCFGVYFVTLANWKGQESIKCSDKRDNSLAFGVGEVFH